MTVGRKWMIQWGLPLLIGVVSAIVANALGYRGYLGAIGLVSAVVVHLLIPKPTKNELDSSEYQKYLDDMQLEDKFKGDRGLPETAPYDLENWKKFYGAPR